MQHTISRPARTIDAGWLRRGIAKIASALRGIGREPELDLSGMRLTDQLERMLADREYRNFNRTHWL